MKDHLVMFTVMDSGAGVLLRRQDYGVAGTILKSAKAMATVIRIAQ